MKRSIAFSFALLLAASAAWAQPTAADKARAKEAYDRGVEAHKRGDMHKAAEEFARADALAPSAVALQAALDAAVEADDPALGAELLERANREPASGALAGSVQTARSKLGGRAGRVRVLCPSSSKCLAKLDEKFIDVDKAVWAKTGQHTIVIQVDGEAQTKLVDLKSEQMLDVVPSSKTAPVTPPPAPTSSTTAPPKPPPSEPPPPPRSEPPSKHVASHGLPRVVFYAGIGATLLLGGATGYLALDTKKKHDEFTDAGCDRANFFDCDDLQRDGKQAQDLTNIALAATAVAGVATAVIGIAFTDWGGPAVAFVPGGFQGGWSKKF